MEELNSCHWPVTHMHGNQPTAMQDPAAAARDFLAQAALDHAPQSYKQLPVPCTFKAQRQRTKRRAERELTAASFPPFPLLPASEAALPDKFGLRLDSALASCKGLPIQPRPPSLPSHTVRLCIRGLQEHLRKQGLFKIVLKICGYKFGSAVITCEYICEGSGTSVWASITPPASDATLRLIPKRARFSLKGHLPRSLLLHKLYTPGSFENAAAPAIAESASIAPVQVVKDAPIVLKASDQAYFLAIMDVVGCQKKRPEHPVDREETQEQRRAFLLREAIRILMPIHQDDAQLL